jgi:hypothetical protein
MYVYTGGENDLIPFMHPLKSVYCGSLLLDIYVYISLYI